jgi:hypothetical protein
MIASRITVLAGSGVGFLPFSSIRWASSSWSRLPLDHGLELAVLLLAEADIAGVDAVLGERLGAGRMLAEERVAVVVEVADQRHLAADRIQPLADPRHRGGGLMGVDGEPHQLRTRVRQRLDLGRGSFGIGGVGVGHRLHHDGRAAADQDAPDRHADARSPPDRIAALAHRRRLVTAPVRDRI